MCGFAGFIKGPASSHFASEPVLREMGKAIRHRGPDDHGTWLDTSGNVGLIHQRLSILDLSPQGRQPMESPSGRYVIAFNGEIYNHLELRLQLNRRKQLVAWRGSSDTETLAAFIEEYGVKSAISKLEGMFAFAVWDKKERCFYLVRDRIGEKPLYYGWHKSGLIFGSELKALLKHPDFVRDIDRNVLVEYCRHFYVPSPHCIWKNTFKLMPGSYSRFSESGECLETVRYWNVLDVYSTAQSNVFSGSKEEAVDELERILGAAVRKQMLSDVPLGAFLSGGVDSSTIVALMQAHSNKPVKTFAIGFNENAYNEAGFAKKVANHLGTEHTEFFLNASDVQSIIPKLPRMYDEPFADSSQLPTSYVMQLAKTEVSVALSGDGGDELFCGYGRYAQALAWYHRLDKIPYKLRSNLASLVHCLPGPAVNSFLAFATGNQENYYDKLLKFRKIVKASSLQALYYQLVTLWEAPERLILDGHRLDTSFTASERVVESTDNLDFMMARDLDSYLPDDILVKVDRSAMAVSLETRIPLLDHKVIEFACGLPSSYKLNEGTSKWPLRQVLYKHVPRELIERPKKGFSVPMSLWLKGPLRGYVLELLAKERIQKQGIFNAVIIEQLVSQHLSGKRNWADRLWSLVVFQLWIEEYAAC